VDSPPAKVNSPPLLASPTRIDVIKLSEFKDIHSVSTQGTSAIYNGVFGGEKYFIKEVVKGGGKRKNAYGVSDIELAMNEVLASMLYTDVYNVPAVELSLVVNDIGPKYQKYLVASKSIVIDTCEPITQDCQDLIDNKVKGAIEPLLVDCILANWDVGSRGNVGIITIGSHKSAFRIDVGGALLFRALGQKRQFTEKPTEHDTFFSPTNKGYKLFKNITNTQIKKAFEIIDLVNPEVFSKLQTAISKQLSTKITSAADRKKAISVLDSLEVVKKRHEYYTLNRDSIKTSLAARVIPRT
jgi:hypothetical protein